MKMQIVEPSVVRLTSDETRALMKIALNPQPVTVDHGGRGIIDLGLVRAIRPRESQRKKAKREIAKLKARLGVPYKRAKLLVGLISKAEDALRYSGRQSAVYALTAAGTALVKGVTIRRR